MATADAPATGTQGLVRAGDVDLWADQRGAGPDVLLMAGLSDPAEAWEAQLEGLADRYRLTAFDNRGAGRSPMPPEGFTSADMADDAAALLQALGLGPVHVLGFSGGSANAQELALRHPELVRSLVLVSTFASFDDYMRVMTRSMTWIMEAAKSERAALEAFFVWIYTRRAHADGTVAAIIDEALAFPHPQPPEGFRRQLDAWSAHDTNGRLHEVAVPTLVIAGDEDIITPPRICSQVADQIPGAELVVLPGEAHQPFQERPEAFNDLVHRFWSDLDGGT